MQLKIFSLILLQKRRVKNELWWWGEGGGIALSEMVSIACCLKYYLYQEEPFCMKLVTLLILCELPDRLLRSRIWFFICISLLKETT